MVVVTRSIASLQNKYFDFIRIIINASANNNVCRTILYWLVSFSVHWFISLCLLFLDCCFSRAFFGRTIGLFFTTINITVNKVLIYSVTDTYTHLIWLFIVQYIRSTARLSQNSANARCQCG